MSEQNGTGSIINIEPASRAGAHLLIQVFGGPQSGKTRTALRLARGIAGPNGKIGVLDTESGRARLYADKVPGGFFVGEMQPPYTPRRYIEAIEAFVQFGADVLVIDSFSHVWQGVGGVLDMAENSGAQGLQKWLKPKTDYRRLVQFLLSTTIHIIFCSRAKQPVVEGKDDNGKKTLKTMPWEPIQDKTLKYEMTIVLPMLLNGTYETSLDRAKWPDDLSPLFASGALLTEETGEQIAAWVAGGKPVDHAGELLRIRADEAKSGGTAKLKEFWESLSKAERLILKPRWDDYKSAAKTVDDERAREMDDTASGPPVEIEGVS